MSSFGFALVGCGSIAKKHAHAVHEYLEDANIAAFVATDIARVRKCSAKYGAPAFSSPDEMMRAVGDQVAIKDEMDQAIAAVLEDTAFIGGAQLKVFEQGFAKYCGVDHCVGVANGTDALFIALRTLGIGAGDEVITVANSFVATSEAIRMAGAQVVFVDIDPRTYNIDVTQIEAKATPRTKAIIPVHLYGQPADMDPIRAIAKRHDLRIIGDAAQAHGAIYKGQPIATLADITCYSFYPGKNLGAYGDAGALVMNNAEWAVSARMFANHGRSDKYNHAFEGVNSRLDGLQAAVLNVKLRHIEGWTEQRRRAAQSYRAALASRQVTLPEELPDVRAVYHLFVVRVPGERREALQAFLKEAGIDTGVHYPIALPLLTAYRHLGHTDADFTVAARAAKEIVSLPIFPELTTSISTTWRDRSQSLASDCPLGCACRFTLSGSDSPGFTTAACGTGSWCRPLNTSGRTSPACHMSSQTPKNDFRATWPTGRGSSRPRGAAADRRA